MYKSTVIGIAFKAMQIGFTITNIQNRNTMTAF